MASVLGGNCMRANEKSVVVCIENNYFYPIQSVLFELLYINIDIISI
jgi:hypothetical protein